MSAPAPGTVLFTSGELSSRLAASLRGAPDVGITGIEILDAAGPTHLSFIRDAKNVASWKAGRCGAALASQAALGPSPPEPGPGRALIVVPDADLALIQVLASMQPPPLAPPGVHPSAVVDPSASIGEGASIGPLSWIGPGASIGAGTVVSAGAMIGRAARIGAKCLLHPRVTVLERCLVGDHCILHSGVVLGADGFGYRPAPGGKGLIKVPHIGIVELEPHVEVGANSAIDRAKFGVTRIGAGTKIDNLVQIGHNCVIGRACVICGNVGIGGSTRIGDGVMIGGGVGIADQRTIGPGASIGAGSGVMEDIPAGQTWFGFPAQPVPHAMKMVAAVRQLPGALSKVRRFLRQQGVDLD